MAGFTVIGQVMATPARWIASQVQDRATDTTFRTQHPSALAAPPVQSLVQDDRPGLMPCTDYELITHDVSDHRFIPALKESGKSQPRTLLDVRHDHAFLPPPATPATHDDPVGFTEMIEF